MIEYEFEVRKQFLPLFEDNERWACVVAHRRAGKTCASIQKLIMAALETQLEHSRYAFVAPQYNQAKSIAWDLLKNMCKDMPGVEFNESELRVDFPNTSRIRLFGADNPKQPMRGQRFDGIVLDEVAQMPVNFWGEVVRPALADRKGWAVFIGTPAGKNLFYDFYQQSKTDDDWTSLFLSVDKTGIIDDEELAGMRRTMRDNEYEQEMLCSFDAAIRGAFYGNEMKNAEARVTNVPHDPMLPVITSWDLGVADSTVIWYWQVLSSGEIRAINCQQFEGMGLPDIVQQMPRYNYSQHILPHDVRVRELGSGKSRLEVLSALGLDVTVAPNQPISDGINAFRGLIARIWFDVDKCGTGVEALRQYRTEFDPKLNAFKKTPRHDWSSHFADAARYFAITPWQTGQWAGDIEYGTSRYA
jgi:phage terminase large subunit